MASINHGEYKNNFWISFAVHASTWFFSTCQYNLYSPLEQKQLIADMTFLYSLLDYYMTYNICRPTRTKNSTSDYYYQY